MNCSSTGSSMTEYVYMDSSCSGSAHQATIPTNHCTPINGGQYAEWACISSLASDEAQEEIDDAIIPHIAKELSQKLE